MAPLTHMKAKMAVCMVGVQGVMGGSFGDGRPVQESCGREYTIGQQRLERLACMNGRGCPTRRGFSVRVAVVRRVFIVFGVRSSIRVTSLGSGCVAAGADDDLAEAQVIGSFSVPIFVAHFGFSFLRGKAAKREL